MCQWEFYCILGRLGTGRLVSAWSQKLLDAILPKVKSLGKPARDQHVLGP